MKMQRARSKPMPGSRRRARPGAPFTGRFPLGWVAAVVLLTLSCGDSGAEPPPPPPPAVATAVAVTPASVTLTAIEETIQLTAEVRDQNGQVMSGAAVTWSSSAPSVASVDAAGVVVARADGSATVTATAGSASGSAAVSVEQAPADVRITPDSVTLTAIDDTIQLTAEVRDRNGQVMSGAAVTWSSSDPSVASVDADGVVKTWANGSATITARAGDASGSAAVSVAQAPAMVVISFAGETVTSIQLVVGSSIRLMAIVVDRNGIFVAGAVPVTWSSSDTSVVSVHPLGLVMGVGLGSATVTASSDLVSGKLEVSVETIGASPDREALEALYRATGGPGWTRDDNWLTDAPLRDWFGVKMAPWKANRVAELVLANNRLTGSIPPELGSLTALETLGLEGNRLTGPIPGELAGLTNLFSLHLSSNRLSGPIPSELGNLGNARRIALDNNFLTGPIPPELGNLPLLESLLLDFNQLSGAIPRELGKLISMEELILTRNRLTGSIPSELGNLRNLEVLALWGNSLTGPVPPSFGGLSRLTRLILTDNAGLTGSLPPQLANLNRMDELSTARTGLCAPADSDFQKWLERVRRAWVPLCGDGSTAYLTQAVQSPRFPVPLVAGEEALLRVFPTAARANSENLPAVRARFFLAGSEVHVANVPSRPGPIPTEMNEGSLEASVNALIPATVISPGLEMVVEIDPEGQLDPALGVAGRIPESGRVMVSVEPVPTLDVTFIPFIWSANPDSSVVGLTTAMAADPQGHEMLFQVRTLLPVAGLEVTAHEPVLSSSNHAGDLIAETEMIRVAEGGTGHYAGLMAEMSGARGVAETPGWVSVSIPTDWIIAHELGHNMSLDHAPCNTNSAVDLLFPQADGTIGAWGYDFRAEGRLVPPDSPDLMGYCSRNQWISDYSFSHALRYRRWHQEKASAATTESLLLWGGVDGSGALYLEPAFLVDAPPALPDSAGEYRVAGWTADGRELFSLPFTMPRTMGGDGASSFAFAVPAGPGWAGDLAGVTLSGPGGSVTLDGDTDRPMAILRDPGTGRVRGILRDLPRNSGNPAAAAARTAVARGVLEPNLQVLFSRGMPGASAWRR